MLDSKNKSSISLHKDVKKVFYWLCVLAKNSKDSFNVEATQSQLVYYAPHTMDQTQHPRVPNHNHEMRNITL